ncbi:MAG: hypothetical protein R3B90_04880 [Planctomycetaceae bacterium]
MIQEHYGDILEKLGRHEEAVAAWKKAFDAERPRRPSPTKAQVAP